MQAGRGSRLFLALAGALWLAAATAEPAPAATAATVENFTPQGSAKNVRQVLVRFSAPMIAFGDPRPADPFDATCPEPGSGRWLDDKSWSYDFERDLPAGIRCRFAVRRDLRDGAGNAVLDKTVYEFSTGGPLVVYSQPFAGSQAIDENQIFMLGLDAPATEKSILKNVSCRVEGVDEKIGVRIVDGRERRELLQQRSGFRESFARLYFQQRGIDAAERFKDDDPRLDELPIVLLQCKRSLFPGARVDLVWGGGVSSASGIAGSAEQSLSFRTRPEFTAKFNCERISVKAQCIPFLPMTLNFSAPVKAADARRIVLRAADGAAAPAYAPQIDGDDAFVQSVTFKGPFPEQARFAIELPADLRDDAQRKLANQASFPIAVATDDMPPLAKFAAPFGIVELNGDAALPVTLRNIEPQVDARIAAVAADAKAPVAGKTLRFGAEQDKQIQDWFYRLEQIGRPQWNERGEIDVAPGERSLFAAADTAQSAQLQHFQLPKPNGAQAFEVVGIPLPKPGFYVVELASPKLGAALLPKAQTMYVQAAALVTNMAVHFKRGAESSAVWVTALDSAQPVAGAAVAVRDCSGATLWQGNTAADGVARIAQALPKKRCDDRGDDYFVSARRGDDFSFVLSSWGGGIQPWRFNLPYAEYDRSNLLLHTVFDRTLLMANDTLHMKHFRRAHTAAGVALPTAADENAAAGAAAKKSPDKVVIRHIGSDQTYELPLTWSANGSADSQWKVPADAKQGTYQVEIGGRPAGAFRVEAFRVPTMRAVVQGPAAPAVRAAKVDVDIQLNYLAGGAAAQAPVKLRSAVENRAVEFRDYDDYVFANGTYRSDENAAEGDADGEAPAGGVAQSAVRTQNLQLDGDGAARAAIESLPRSDVPRTLRAELEYRDANGETATATTRIALWPSRYLVGLQRSGDDGDGRLRIAALVLDLAGKPVANAAVAVELLQRSYLSHRRRLLGGFYAYENNVQVKPLGKACSGVTDGSGVLRCSIAPPASGNLIVQATAVDAQGNASSAHQDRWVAGADDMWFAATDNDRIDVLPERKQYEPGETATLQVRMPFRSATALIAVEREGVLDTYVQTLSGKDPVVRVPIKNSYAPNLYVSVFVVRGRVAEPQPTALVDLGKPAYKMGIAELRVGWRAHELKVAVDSDRPVYKVRDKAAIKIKVRRADGSAPPAGSEVALAAIDEGLLELQPNDSWQLLDAMMQRRPLEVETATAQLQVIGKRHYGRKAVPHGGGGGRSAARELLDAALFWRSRIALDANGEAKIDVPLNDALTSFRVVAIASGGSEWFGTGATTLRSAQDLMLIGGLPPLVREGDRQSAGFTVRNASNKTLQVALTATVKPQPAAAAATAPAPLQLPAQNVELAPGQAREIVWPLTVPAGSAALQWEIAARDKTSRAADRLRIEQKVAPVLPLRTLQATLVQLDKPFELPVQLPAGAVAERGGIETTLVDKLGAALPGVREYMAAYPHDCFEQRASKAIALRDAAAWQALMGALPTYLDRDGLVKYFPRVEQGSDALTAYVLSVADAAGYAIPAASLQKMREGLLGFVEGKVARRSELPAADLAIRKLAALAALARFEPVRPQLLDSLNIEPQRWPTSALLDWVDILQRSAQLPQRDAALHDALQILRSRLTWQGSSAAFSTERSDLLWWLMVSGDSNVNRLILSVLDDPAWRGDLGRLLRGALGRQKRGHWDTTVANAWGTLAFEKFSAKYESATVTGTTQVQWAGDAASPPAAGAVDWKAMSHGGSVLLPWPAQTQTLRVEHHGAGAPWALVRSKAALPSTRAIAGGYRIVKSVSAIERKTDGVWSVGDVYRVHLEVTAQSDMTWVAIDDPIPAGATVLGGGLGNDSALLTATAKVPQRAPTFEERGFAAYRAYYQFAPKGTWSLDYSVRLNNAGEFGLPPTHVEAMYAPETFGETPNANWTVTP